jgi:hypothetical protein
MKYDKLKKGLISLALAGVFLLGAGFINDTFANNSGNRLYANSGYGYSPPPQRYRDWERRRYWEWRREREARLRYRRMERERWLHYRYGAYRRGYYDWYGRFHRY